jgi:hypothetical protein
MQLGPNTPAHPSPPRVSSSASPATLRHSNSVAPATSLHPSNHSPEVPSSSELPAAAAAPSSFSAPPHPPHLAPVVQPRRSAHAGQLPERQQQPSQQLSRISIMLAIVGILILALCLRKAIRYSHYSVSHFDL